MSKLTLHKQQLQETVVMMEIGLKLTEIGMKNNKTPEEMVKYYAQLMDEFNKVAEQQTE